jgi:nucleotide-binding universal stress UspA family protein
MSGVIVGVDGSEHAAAALRWAEGVAGRRGWPLAAVLAWDVLDQFEIDHVQGYRVDYGRPDAEAALAAYVIEALGPDRAARVSSTAKAGAPAEVLVEAAGDASLLVVGGRGLGAVRKALLGSVGLYCAQWASCPVAIVRNIDPVAVGGPRRIVVGYDGSEASRMALNWALDEARPSGAEVDVVHAWQAPLYGPYAFAGAEAVRDDVHRSARDLLDRAVEGVDAAGLPGPPEAILVEGAPTRTLLETAKGADLVVVGSRGRGGFAGLLLGSTSQQLATHLECPIVIVHPSQEG